MAAASSATFAVTIHSIRCPDLPRPSAGRVFNPFVKINFDSFKKFETAPAQNQRTPAFSEEFSFDYSTRYPDALGRKYMTVEVYAHNAFSAHELIGSTRVDLLTLAAGCVSHSLTLREGAADGSTSRPARGVVDFSVRMTQRGDAAATLTDVRSSSGVTGQVKAVIKRQGGRSVSVTGAAMGSVPAIVLPAVTLAELADSTLELSVLDGAGAAVAVASLPLGDAMPFKVGESRVFTAACSKGGGNMTATLTMSNSPTFAQLISDSSRDPEASGLVNRDSGITGAGAKLVHPLIATRPLATIHSLTQGVKAASGASVSSSAGSSNAPGFACIYLPGVTPAPPLSGRLFGGTPGLPTCWLRRVDAAAGRLAFENMTTNMVELQLPTQSEYVVTVPPAPDGAAEEPLGIAFEPNFSGMQRFGWRSGRRNSGFDAGAVVRSVKAGGYAARHIPGLRPGHHLLAINGSSVLRSTFDVTIHTLKSAGRPLVLRFHDPYAVPPALATSVSAITPGDAEGSVAGTIVGTLEPSVSVGSVMLQGVPADVLADAGGAGASSSSSGGTASAPTLPPPSRKMMAAAQETLDMALDAFGRVDIHAPLLAAAAAGSDDTSAATDAASVQTALSDPGFLRSLNTVMTGTAQDVLPRATAAAASQGAAEAEEEDDPMGGGSTVKKEPPATSDAAAERAFKVAAVLTAVDDEHYGGADKLCRNPAIRPQLALRAKRMADLGMFRRAVDTVTTRGTPSFAGVALRTMNTIMTEYGLSAGDAHMDASALVTLQTTMRKADFAPVTAEAGKVMEGLIAENPEQDGLAFIEACELAVQKLAVVNSARVRRVRGKDGSVSYATGSATSSTCPPALMEALAACLQADRRGRLLDDGAVVPAPPALLAALPSTVLAHAHDSYIAAVLFFALAKLSAHPTNGGVVLTGGILNVMAQLNANPSLTAEPRYGEGVATLLFNLGRDLDNSDALLDAGAVPRVIALANQWMMHCTNAGGTPCTWAPPGREAQVAEGVIFTGSEKYARDRNAVRPRLARTCVNVLINLACFRSPTSSGVSSVSQIAAAKGVQLLGDLLRAHKREAAVVTAVLNCAANIAFKNREVQLEIGEIMTDGVVLAGQQFGKNAQLMSMALRTIGNLTNQDTNIYRGLGMGVVPMICAAMRANAANVPLQNLAASVLSNIASVEPVDDETAEECAALLAAAYAARKDHPDVELHLAPEAVASHDALLTAGRPVWSTAAWLMLEDGAVQTLIDTMVGNSTDVALVEACLRTLLCIASDEEVAVAMCDRFDVINKALFVMRAADFDVGVQLAGATLLQMLASNPALTARVAGTDAAHLLCSALENHKATVINGLSGVMSTVVALPSPTGAAPGAPVDMDTLLGTLGAALDGRPALAVQLATRAFETLQLTAGPRVAKAVVEMNTANTSLGIVQTAFGMLNALARRGFDVNAPPSVDAMVNIVLAMLHAGCVAVSLWTQGYTTVPSPGGGQPTSSTSEDEKALKAALLSNERIYNTLARIAELATVGSGTAGDPSRPAVQLKAARAFVDVLASCCLASPVLPGRATRESSPQPGKALCSEPSCVDAVVKAGGARPIGAMLLAYATDAVGRAVASPSPDTLALTSRTLLAQLLVLLDSIGGDVPATDAVSLLSAMTGAATAALTSVSARAGFSAHDNAPSPMKLTDIADLARRVSNHLSARERELAGTGASGAGGCAVLETEAAAIFCYSISRARAQMAGVSAGHPGMATPAGGAAASPPPMMRAPSADAAPSGTATRSTLRKLSSARGFVGRLAAREGFPGVFWLEGKVRPCLLRTTPDATALLMYNAKPFLKAKGRAVKSIAENGDFLCNGVPLPLTRVEGTDFVDVRIGYTKLSGKVVKQGGLFGKAPKPTCSVCIDGPDGNTIMQLEFDDAATAEDVRSAIQAIGNNALAAHAAHKAGK